MVSIVICTRNRDFIITECLESIILQYSSKYDFELLVVDNNSSDRTEEIIAQYSKKQSFIKYVQEEKIGLSKARNKAFKYSRYSWICYVDDDSKVRPNFISRIFWLINHTDFDCIGGMYYGWFKYGRPKWIPPTFGSKKLLSNQLTSIENGNISGGIMLLRKEILRNLNGFSPNLGMTNKIGYGEETDFQIRMRQAGYKIGFDPELIIDHCVMPHKLKLHWHLKAQYAKGRDKVLIYENMNTLKVIIGFIRTAIASFGIKLLLAIFYIFFKKDYFWQNAIIDIFGPIWARFGQLEGIKKLSKH